MVSSDGLSYTGIAIGIALLGGVSAYGRRGGIFGTILATGLFVLAYHDVDLHAWRGGELIVIATALGVGLAVTRLIEAYGRPGRGASDDPEASLSWLGRQQGSWVRELPASIDEPTWVDSPEERWRTR
jgi:hypothetical protein